MNTEELPIEENTEDSEEWFDVTPEGRDILELASALEELWPHWTFMPGYTSENKQYYDQAIEPVELCLEVPRLLADALIHAASLEPRRAKYGRTLVDPFGEVVRNWYGVMALRRSFAAFKGRLPGAVARSE